MNIAIKESINFHTDSLFCTVLLVTLVIKKIVILNKINYNLFDIINFICSEETTCTCTCSLFHCNPNVNLCTV